MNKFKKLLAGLLAVAMLLSMSACNNTAESNVLGDSTDVTSQAEQTDNNESDTSDKGGIEELSTSFETSDESVTDLQVIQVMAQSLDNDSGDLFSMTDYVAGKNTLLRVCFAEDTEIVQDGSMTVTVSKDGEDVAELLPINNGSGTSAFFTPKTMGTVGNWAAGDYTMTLSYGDITATRTASFREAKKIKVLAVPVIANYGGTAKSCEGEWKTAIQFTKDCYPLAADGIEYVLGNELDLSDDKYDLTTDDGQYYVWEALTQLQTQNNDYELILGFVRDRQGADGTTQGYTYGSPANIITESDGDMQPTVAHEIAHCYNVGDEYEGGSINNAVNPAPYGMSGSDWVNRDLTVSGNKKAVESAANYGSENSGSIVQAGQFPVNTTNMSTLENVGSFMGSGSSNIEDYWITSDIWVQLYKAFVFGNSDYDKSQTGGTAEGTDENGGNSDSSKVMCPTCYESYDISEFYCYGLCETCGEYTSLKFDEIGEAFTCDSCSAENGCTTTSIYFQCANDECDGLYSYEQLFGSTDKTATNKVSKAENTTALAIDITGKLGKDGKFEANPFFTYETDISNLNSAVKGDYSVVMLDKDGNKLSTQRFDVSFTTQSNPPKTLDFSPLNLTVRYNKNTAVIKLMQGEKELYSQNVSANAPEIEFSGITENQAFSGKQTISWKGSDKDNDKLTYELWYCEKENEATVLASNISANSYEIDFDALAGTEEGYLYLFATDGVNTTGIDSAWISVEYKAPDIISTTPEKTQYKITDEIIFDADIYDMQDGWLYADENVSWTLNGREFLTGSTLWVYPYELAPGANTFTLTATNSQGKVSTKDFTFTVIDDESALPQDWSKEDVKSALSNGFIAPLANVNSAITRGQFANLMSNLYWTVWEEGSAQPEYEEGIVTDCGDDDYAQFLMVKLGVMSAENGKFNPNQNLTQEEAAVIMYQICALADPKVAETIEDKAEMVQICINSNVMDESGENKYTAESKITGQLALVRCNRLYEAIFGE